MTAEAYLTWEREQVEKYEFHLGQVFAMAGGSPRHNYLSNAIGAELRDALRDKPCHVLSSDQRIAAEQGARYVYADAVAVCGEMKLQEGTSDVLTNPSVIVEVLSPNTEPYDRGTKWEAYQRLPSLTDYLLLAQSSTRIEHYQREADGSWRYRVINAGGRISLSQGASISIDAIYDGALALPAA